jgi:hypothetical protein
MKSGAATRVTYSPAISATGAPTQTEENTMPRTSTNAVAKAPIFGVPSLATATAIDNEDAVCGLRAAHFRLSARMRELELTFEAKASELRQAFLNESAKILAGSDEEDT